MAPITAVHCPGCGFDNNPRYKFCGMCGSALHVETVRKGARGSAPLTVGGYSILGLGPETKESAAEVDPTFHDDAAAPYLRPRDGSPSDSQNSYSSLNHLLNRNLDYLFEDEQRKRSPRWRIYVGLALLVIAAGTLVWQWQRNGYPWDDLSPLSSEKIGETAPRKANATTTVSKPQDSSAPMTGAQVKSPEPTSSRAETPAAETADTTPRKTPQISTTFRPQSNSSEEKASSAADATPAASKDGSAGSEDAVGERPAAIPDAAADQATSQAEAAQWLTEGTKYLLGNGVAQDCGLANKDLRAASHFSSEAEAMLGTMYASGHCVDRDLPTAYRWYARALHSKPGNSRIQDDLTALWNQMTPAEKKIATRSAP